MRVLAVNPGNTSTKIAVFDEDRPVLVTTVEHQDDALARFASIGDQLDYRVGLVREALGHAGLSAAEFDAVVGRADCWARSKAAPTRSAMPRWQTCGARAPNMRPIWALRWHASSPDRRGLPAFIVDPVSVDELTDVARVSGVPELPRQSFSHALNMKAIGRRVAADLGRDYTKIRLVVAHLGTGVSLSAQAGGRMIDVSDGRNEGAMSPDRAGGLCTKGFSCCAGPR